MSQNDLTQAYSQPTPAQHSPEDHDDPEDHYEQKVYGVQLRLMEEVKSGVETLMGSLEGVQRCLSPNKGLAEAITDTCSWL